MEALTQVSGFNVRLAPEHFPAPPDKERNSENRGNPFCSTFSTAFRFRRAFRQESVTAASMEGPKKTKDSARWGSHINWAM
jgi:hypothetical protein